MTSAVQVMMNSFSKNPNKGLSSLLGRLAGPHWPPPMGIMVRLVKPMSLGGSGGPVVVEVPISVVSCAQRAALGMP